MASPVNNTAIARKVELIIRKLDSLSTLPQVAAGFLPHITGIQTDPAALTDIIESDPALTAKILSLAHAGGVTFTSHKPSVAQAVSKLPLPVIRDAVLSIRVFQAFDVDVDPDSKRILPRKQLAFHALATACCARSIAKIVLTEQDCEVAFSAGLLHDIGKLAIDEAMPKSFEKIVEYAKSNSVSMAGAEQKHLGLDHTIIGKRLAEKWKLPEEIKNAIWLHHAGTEVLPEDIPSAKIARIVSLADSIARQCAIGHSGSCGKVSSTDQIMASLGLTGNQLDEIRKNLSQQVYHRADLLGLNDRTGAASWCDMISRTAADLARDNTRLSQDNRTYAVSSGHVDFVEQFFSGVDPSDAPIDIAAVFGQLWQKHYQTGPVAVYLCDDPSEPLLDVAMVDNSSQVDTAVVTTATGRPAVPESLREKFAIIPAGDCASWIFEQIALVIDSSKAFIAPLRAGTKTVGAIIFEKRLPGDLDTQLSVFSLTSAVAANVIALSLASQRQGRLAERFAELLGRLRDTRDKLAASTILTGIAEMAAGAGHEMNNPLSVISGRVQLLMESENDDNKKQILKQIMDRSDEMSQIISDMMSFARPKDPSVAACSIKKLLDAAVSKTTELHELTAMEVTYNAVEQLGEVFVDAGQIITAISAVLSNALDSYKGGSGPITIDGSEQQGTVVIRISDTGCGMAADTLEKAFQPFFSDKLAGRKRGMGLARAMRLIELNNGSINIESKLEEGTTVTITLPANAT